MGNSTFKFSKYRAEADRPPFDLELEDGSVISIPVPDGDTTFEIEEAGTSREMLRLMCGDQADAVFELIGPENGTVIRSLAKDMSKHFGLAPEQAPRGGFDGLAALIEHAGEAIEYDLHAHLGMDLLDFFRGVYPWDKLYRLIDQLPWWSKYKLLIADDDEFAEQSRVKQGGGSSGLRRPKLAEWDPNRELTAELRDGFARLEAAIANSNRKKGSQPVKPKPTPRPLTAAQRVERRADYETHLDIVKQVLPGR